MTDTLESSIAALLERIVGCFRRNRVPYALIGAWALMRTITKRWADRLGVAAELRYILSL